MPLHLSLSPERQIHINPHTPVDENNEAEQTIRTWFSQSVAFALLRIAVTKMPTSSFSQSLAYWYTVGSHFIEKKRKQCVYTPETLEDVPFDASWWVDYIDQAPPMLGGEYLDIRVFQNLWVRMNHVLTEELRKQQLSFMDYLAQNNPNWQKIGQVCFHLAENKNDSNYPFAFLATYASGFSDDKTTAQHIPLSQALRDCAGDHSNKQLLHLFQTGGHLNPMLSGQKLPYLYAVLVRHWLVGQLCWTSGFPAPCQMVQF
jgi:non-specific serine/threonine protein kinase